MPVPLTLEPRMSLENARQAARLLVLDTASLCRIDCIFCCSCTHGKGARLECPNSRSAPFIFWMGLYLHADYWRPRSSSLGVESRSRCGSVRLERCYIYITSCCVFGTIIYVAAVPTSCCAGTRRRASAACNLPSSRISFSFAFSR